MMKFACLFAFLSTASAFAPIGRTNVRSSSSMKVKETFDNEYYLKVVDIL
jgi:hypothetical protein